MKLYYAKGSCSLAIRIIIAELGLACVFESVNLKTKITESGIDFLTVNSKGAVPTLETDNHEILTENAVIQQYLADTYAATALLPPIGDIQRYRTLAWLNFVGTDLHKSFGPLFNPNLSPAIKTEIFRPLLKTRLAHPEKTLGKNSYLLGEHFTLPDGYLFVMLSWLPKVEIGLTDFPNLMRYFNTLNTRPSIQKALQEDSA